MNWDAVGAIAESLGAIGVIVSLIYLAVQIRQNTRTLQATAYQAQVDLVQSVNAGFVHNPDTAELIARAFATTEPLTGGDLVRWQAYASSVFRHYDNIYYQRATGTLTEERFRSLRGPLLFILRVERLRDTWREFREGYEDPFRAAMDRLVERAEQER